MRKRHVAVAVVVAVRLAVGGDVDQLLRPRALVGECAQQAVGENSPLSRSRSKATAWEMGPS